MHFCAPAYSRLGGGLLWPGGCGSGPRVVPVGGVVEVVAAVGVAVELPVAFVEHQVVGFTGEGAVDHGGGSACVDGGQVVGV